MHTLPLSLVSERVGQVCRYVWILTLHARANRAAMDPGLKEEQ